jgi:hypothetical protein
VLVKAAHCNGFWPVFTGLDSQGIAKWGSILLELALQWASWLN